jgi:3-oxoisoapionate kinase
MKSPAALINIFYGDDFTGTMSTAEIFTAEGVPTMVFTSLPSVEDIQNISPDIRAVGIAGTSRSKHRADLPDELKPVFKLMRESGAATFLYKVCSTFDSSPEIGSIGSAAEIAFHELSLPFAALLPAAPSFGRYVLFGNLFASAGGEEIFRIDRHPSMASHPVTPMNESDLLCHLEKQTSLTGGLVDIRTLRSGEESIKIRLKELLSRDKKIILFDTLNPHDLLNSCRAVVEHESQSVPPFFIGSHEAAYGIASLFRENEMKPPSPPAEIVSQPEKKEQDQPVFVVSGSCAEVTRKQIRRAKKNGFLEIRIQVPKFLAPESMKEEEHRVIQEALKHLSQGSSVMINTASHGRREGTGNPSLPAIIGTALGKITKTVLKTRM